MGLLLSVHDKGQAGSISQVNLAQAADEILGNAGLSQRLELRISCTGLPRKDTTSKSDPMVVLYQSLSTGMTEWKEVGRTDVVSNNADPQFVRPLLVRYTPDSHQPMRVVVYDVDRLGKPEKLNLASQDYIGEAEFALGDVMSDPAQGHKVPLLDLQAGKQLSTSCAVVLKGERLESSDNRVARMAFSGLLLAKKDVMSQSDPFLRALKLRKGTQDDWVPVFKTEVRDNNPDPVWQPIEVDIRQLCSADDQRPLKLQVFDFKTSGSHALIGECQTTLAALLELSAAPAADKSLALTAPATDKPKAPAGPPGKLVVRQVTLRPGPTVSQQMGGCLGACLSSV